MSRHLQVNLRPDHAVELRRLSRESGVPAARLASAAVHQWLQAVAQIEVGSKRWFELLDSTLDDYGAAYPGFLIMNPRLLAKVSMPVKLWIYSHECGHQFRGPDEETADCFAVQRGRRQGWLTPDGLEEVCKFISPAKGDSMHVSGSHRCEYMRKCYEDPGIR